MNFFFWIVGFVLTGLVCGSISGEIAAKKGYNFGGNFALGFFFNVLGILYAVGIPETLDQKIEHALAISEAVETQKREMETEALEREEAEQREEPVRRAAHAEWDKGVDDALDLK